MNFGLARDVGEHLGPRLKLVRRRDVIADHSTAPTDRHRAPTLHQLD